MSDSYLKRLIDSFEARTEKTAMRIVGDESNVYTFGETLRQIRSIAHRLEQQGVEFGDRVALIGENHPCWAIAYLGIIYRGAVCVPLDPHGEIGALTNFIENSEAKLAFIGPEFKDEFEQIAGRLEHPIAAVTWGELSDFAEWSSTKFPESFADEIPKAAGDDIALLIYTSGTTGTPKGVPLTHGNILAELDGINEVLKLTDKEKILSLLPLFHAYLQIVNLWVATTYGCEVGYLKELSPAELGNAMKKFKPTILTTVPRLWYLFHKKIFDAVAAKPKLGRALVRAMLAANGALRNTIGINLGPKLFSEVHHSFGGKLRLAISAGSRFDEDVATDFHELGFTIIQGYGLTETSPVIAVNRYDVTGRKFGTVGPLIDGVEVKIAEDGEILCKGPNVMMGYYKRPDLTAQEITDGWYHTGDIGMFTENNFLKITDRKKELFKTSGGKYVAPLAIENKLKESPFIEQVMLIGADRKFVSALIVPSFPNLKEWCRKNNIAETSNADLLKNKQVIEMFKELVESFNKFFNHVEQVKKFELLPYEWTVDTGEMTPKLSLKRKVVMEKYKEAVERIYG